MRTIVLAAGWMLIGCNAHTDASPAGPPVERTIAFGDFTAVEVTGPDDVDIRSGRDFAIRVRADPAILDRIDIRRDGAVLRIGRKPGDAPRRAVKARIMVTMPVLHAATLTGSGDIAIDRGDDLATTLTGSGDIAIDRGDDLAATLTGSGDITIGQVRGTQARLALTGSGTIAAAGAVDRLTLSVAGSGDIDARQLKANAADVTVAGSGDATADVTGPARVTLTGSGSATLGSGARCTVTRVGSGEVQCGK